MELCRVFNISRKTGYKRIQRFEVGGWDGLGDLSRAPHQHPNQTQPAVVESLRPRRDSTTSKLTPRQQQVLELIAQGYNNTGIAQSLTLTEKSVETYINSIYQVLQVSGGQGVHSRVKATLIYLQDS